MSSTEGRGPSQKPHALRAGWQEEFDEGLEAPEAGLALFKSHCARQLKKKKLLKVAGVFKRMGKAGSFQGVLSVLSRQLPPHGCVSCDGRFRKASVALPKVKPLNLKVAGPSGMLFRLALKLLGEQQPRWQEEEWSLEVLWTKGLQVLEHASPDPQF